MSNLYRYYQKIGGNDDWKLTHADSDLSLIKPTFITVLSLDTQVEDEPTREHLDSIKYIGPMYFDLDAADISDSIAGGQALLAKLLDSGLKVGEFDIYLSGKKGLHFLIPMQAFVEKPAPVAKLPAIYKEMAFKLAVDTVDFKVYTGRKGRMLRTCYNIRENGNYRVPITAAELETLTAESYDELCKTPRFLPEAKPTYNREFSLVYEAAHQKVAAQKRRKPKAVDTALLKSALPTVQRILAGDRLADIGFNKIAIQLAVYARESNWSEDDLVTAAQGLCETHVSDGRYNTPKRREHELRRMYAYVADNSAYEYESSMLRSCLEREVIAVPTAYVPSDDSVDEPEDTSEGEEFFAGGVFVSGRHYAVMRADEMEQQISNFVFRKTERLLDMTTGHTVGYHTNIRGKDLILQPAQFTSSSGLQNAVATAGLSFTGTDTHARGTHQIMLREITQTSYVIDSEGLNVVRLPRHPNPEVAAKPFLVWADREAVILPRQFQVLNEELSMKFVGSPDERGVFQTDLTRGPMLVEWLARDDNKRRLQRVMKSMFMCSDAQTVGKILGWMVAAHYKQLFVTCWQKFPLLHVYGLAGLGKTEFTSSFMRMFYFNEEPKMTTPSSTPFAFLTFVGGSASVPILLDEWKPAAMAPPITEKYKSIFRDSYNNKETQRGGGSKMSDKYNALGRIKLSAPIIYIAESAETETAVVERSVMVPFKRSHGVNVSMAAETAYSDYAMNLDVWGVLGRQIAADLVKSVDIDEFRHQFEKIHATARRKFILQPEDFKALEDGTLSQEDYAVKGSLKDRPIYNNCVVVFGLRRLATLLKAHLGDLFDSQLDEFFRTAIGKVFTSNTAGTVAAQPEYIKVLSTMSDMSRMRMTGSEHMWLTEGVEYNISEMGGKPVLILASRFAYVKYRQFCRAVGTTAMYPNETSFEIALGEVPAFMVTGPGTQSVQVSTAILDLEILERAGMPPYAGKVVRLKP